MTFLNLNNTRKDDTTYVLVPIIYTLIFIVSVIGNCLFIAAVVYNVNMRTTMNLFVANMAASDLLATVVSLPPQFAGCLSGFQWPFQQESLVGLVVCKTSVSIWFLSFIVSLDTFIFMSFERLLAVFFPVKRSFITRRTTLSLFIIWATCLAFTIPSLIFLRVFKIHGSRQCWIDSDHPLDNVYWIFIIAQTGLTIVALLTVYPAIVIKLWKRKLPGNPSSANQEIRDRINRRVTWMASTLMTVFVVSWIPFFVIAVILIEDKYIYKKGYAAFESYGNMLRVIGLLVSHLSYTLNPVICVAFNTDFRRYVKKICCLIPSSKRTQISSHKTSSIHLANKPEMERLNLKGNKRKMAQTTL